MNPKTKINTAILVIFIVIGGLFLFGKMGFNILSGLRAYVGGEGLWAKGQKEATYQLTQYIFTKDEKRYHAFKKSLMVPLGDKTARLELEKSNPVYETVFQGFKEGGNHPEDIPTMIFLYKNFKNFKHIQEAINQWEKGDELIENLLVVGENLHTEISNNNMDEKQTAKALETIDDLQKKLNEVEYLFSVNMTMAARWTGGLLFALMLVFTVIGSVLCFLVVRYISGIASDLNSKNIQLEQQVAKEISIKQQLRESEERFRRLAENAVDMIYRMSLPDGKYEYVSPASTEIFGYSPQEFYNSPVLIKESIHPDWKDYFSDQWEKLLAGNMPPFYEYQIIHKSGEERWLNQRNVLVQDNSGKTVAIEGIVTDVTDRKLMEEEASRQQAEFSAMFKSITDAIVFVDKERRIMMVNPAFTKELGYQEEEVIGRTTEFIYADPEAFHKQGKVRFEPKAVINKPVFENTYKRKDGTTFEGETLGVHVKNQRGEVIGFLGVIRDITERKKADENILKLKKLDSVGLLAGGIAHDFNNILAAILGNINLALYDNNLDDKIRGLLTEAEKASKRAKGLTQQLLTFSKGGEPVKMTASLEKVIIESANFVLHGDKIACKFNIADNLKLVDVDKGQISQVIQNIVMNSSQAMPAGGIIEITCENVSALGNNSFQIRNDASFVVISIKDNGIGISESDMEKIFDPYFSTKSSGEGLGLAICHSIIKKHDGDIFVESTPGEGTTFNIILPASDKPLPASKISSQVIKRESPEKILVMDDEEMVQNVAKSMLNRLGHEVVLASDGNEAIHLYKKAMNTDEPVNLVIMDLTIPGGMGGKDAVQEILKVDPEAKVIVASGYSNDPVMANWSDYGFSAAIVKPFELNELSSLINKTLC